MDRNELIELFNDLDKELETSVDIILIGGAAMILYYGTCIYFPTRLGTED